MARSADGLLNTAGKVQEVNSDVKFISSTVDLSTASRTELLDTLKAAFDPTQSPKPSRAIVVHNAGSLQHLVYLKEMKDIEKITSYFHFNISSVITINALFLEAISCHPGLPTTVVNISSLCGIQPSKTWGLYCTGKAARDMVFRVLAEEEPQLRVVNYAPGPLDNDMMVIARTETKDKDTQAAFISMKEQGTLLTCNQSAEKLFTLLERDTFTSADHVDYYDV